ncbi:HAMP domain-containing sensor histidine kinase [Lachnospiraceae bacterium 38-14]|jgi:Signal transduction histidine kinase|nr:HAMP domain-containing sensor histidine kinase [Lachnospiraceae bacterium]
MAERIMLIICAAVILILAYKLRRLSRDICEYHIWLEQCLNRLIDGKELSKSHIPKDTLKGRTENKLYHLSRIWQQKSDSAGMEQKQIKELISDISHQTKTPTANIKLYTEMLSTETDHEKIREFVKNIESQTEKLDFLMESMIKMSRLEAGIIEIRQKPENLFFTLQKALSAIVPKAEQKGITLSVNCPENISVSHDTKWTEEAVFNVLDNGVKYTPYGGRIRVAVKRQEIYTKISIKDTGKGIAKDRQAQIFTRFYREPEVHETEGIGVGLYLARKIITLQKGYMQVQSGPGEGSEFSIFLPNKT